MTCSWCTPVYRCMIVQFPGAPFRAGQRWGIIAVMTLDAPPVVLVVDDDPGQVAIVTSVLKKAGFRVLSASSGLAALDVAGDSGVKIYLLVRT